ncbi:hypothetical protein, partial [Sporisorium scitamineum]
MQEQQPSATAADPTTPVLGSISDNAHALVQQQSPRTLRATSCLIIAVGDPSRLASALASAYSRLQIQTATFDTEHHALALVLVHAAFSLTVLPKSAEVADPN